MMSIPMDNVSNHSHLPSRELVQRLFNKNLELENKLRKAAHTRIPSDPNAWQKIRENYETILLEDLAFSEQHEIELALWQLHYRKIEELRAHLSASRASVSSTSSQNGKGPNRAGSDRATKIRSHFKTFLSEATGFYHDLMVKIRAKYGIPLDFSSSDYGNQIMSKGGNISADVKQSLISCHRCLIYLGDLARYKGSFGEPDFKAREYAAAASYYSQASSLWPTSGNPHHQLAILASYSGDELVTVYRYFRSLSVDNPFTTARDNLTIAFEKNRQSYSQLFGEAKASVKEVQVTMTGKGRGRGRGRGEARAPKDKAAEGTLVKERESNVTETLKFFKVRFIRLNGILFTRTSLETFEEVFTSAREDMLQLLSSGHNEEYNFGSDAAECTLVIIRMVAVLIFTVHNVKKESENQSYAEILQRSLLLQHAFNAIFNFMGNILERCTQLSDPSTSYKLPGILVFVEWLACHQDIAVGIEAEEKQSSSRSIFWNLYVSFLNKLLASSGLSMSRDEDETCFFNMSRYDETETTNRLALFEDFELRGFLPLVPAQQILDFSRRQPFGSDGFKEKQARVQRIIAAGKALENIVQVGQHKIYFDSKGKRFTIGVEPQVSDDYLITSSLEISNLNDVGEENPQGFQRTLKVLEPMLQSPIEGEEEDEEIVFKPTMFEKLADGVASKPTLSEVQHDNAYTIKVGLGNHLEPVSASYNGSLFQNSLHNTIGPPSSLASITNHYMPPAQPTPLVQSATSNWMLEKEVPLLTKLANSSLVENGFPGTLELQDRFGPFKPTGLSVPFPHQSVNASSGIRYSVQLPEASIPSKFDSVTSLGAGIDNLSMKASIAPPGLRKNPVSRPVRHSGPPPGFSSVPTKQADVSLPELALKNNPPTVDDYSWLDGYKPPSSTQGTGFNGTVNQPSHLYHDLDKLNNSLAEVTSFPFPGKQMQSLQVQGDKQSGWPEYRFSEQIRLYQEQQNRQYGNENQQSSALPDQHQGQSLWEGRFLV